MGLCCNDSIYGHIITLLSAPLEQNKENDTRMIIVVLLKRGRAWPTRKGS